MIEPLQKLAELFGIPAPLDTHEDATHWRYYREVDAARLAGPTALVELQVLLPELRTAYGNALTLKLENAGLIEFELSAAKPNEPLDDLKTAIDDGSVLTLNVTIDKAALIDRAVTTHFFLFREALVRWLSQPLTDLDAQLFANVPAGRKLVILVASHDILLDGPFLTVAGGRFMSGQAGSPVPHGSPEMLALAHITTNWVQFDLNRVTPLHLIFDVRHAADDDPIAAALHAQLFLCSLLYLASRSTRDAAARAWTCTFAADRQETDIRLKDGQGVPREAAQTLGELARWVYETDRRDDRFIVLQRTFVDGLQHNSAETNGAEVVRLAPELAKRVKWGWEAFVSGELKKYIEQVKALEDTVSATAKDYNEQVGALATALIANMLAAVGVVLGSFLAAIFKSPFDPNVFRFGTGIYVAYLLLFPMAVGLTATWQRFRKSRDTFEARKKSFAQRLRADPVDSITRSILGKSESWFGWWYFGSILAYAAVVVALIVAIVRVPPAIERWNGNPDEFVLRGAFRNQPVTGSVTIRGARLDKEKDIVVTLGRSVFTNATEPASLKVHGTTSLVFTPQPGDLVAKTVTVRQGDAGPKSIPLR